jgi:two-component system chemotaxis response regulator CheB
VVQDPDDAAFPEMPLTALNRSRPDHVVHLADIPALLDALVHQPAGDPVPASDRIKFEVEIAKSGRATMNEMDHIGKRSVLSCPDCGGVMWELDENHLLRYRCHVGHAYTGELMSLAVDDSLRRALGSALRALDERTALVHKLEQQAKASGRNDLAQSWARRGQEFEREAKIISHAIGRLDHMVGQAAE